MDQNKTENSSFLPPPSFKSRFLKTERSEALLQEQTTAIGGPNTVGLHRSIRSTFSPLAKLPENIEIKPSSQDRITKNIKEFISRTDHVSNEWREMGSNPKRSGSVEPDGDRSMGRPAHVRASSMVPPSRDPFLQQLRDNSSSGYGSYTFKDGYGSHIDEYTNSVSVRGVSHSVTNRARNGGGGPGLCPHQRFMSLEEECNWILSGREPVNGYDDDSLTDEDVEDNTLDDISGDEVHTK